MSSMLSRHSTRIGAAALSLRRRSLRVAWLERGAGSRRASRSGMSSDAVGRLGWRRRPCAAAAAAHSSSCAIVASFAASIEMPLRRAYFSTLVKSVSSSRACAPGAKPASKPRWQTSPTGDPSDSRRWRSRRGKTRAILGGHAAQWSGQGRVEAIVGHECGHGGEQLAVVAHGKIQPFEAVEARALDRAVVRPVLEIARKQPVPLRRGEKSPIECATMARIIRRRRPARVRACARSCVAGDMVEELR